MTDFDPSTFQRAVIDHAMAAVVEFHAPWCPFGALLGPKMRKVDARNGGQWLVGRLNVMGNEEFAREMGVEFVPALAVYLDGARRGVWYGDPPLGAVLALLDRLSNGGGS